MRRFPAGQFSLRRETKLHFPHSGKFHFASAKLHFPRIGKLHLAAGASPRPTVRSYHGSLREGAAAGTRLGESVQRKALQSCNPCKRGLLPSRLRVPPPSRREALPSPSRFARHLSQSERQSAAGASPRPTIRNDLFSSRTKLHRGAPRHSVTFVARRNFTFRTAENFTLRREQAPALQSRIISLRRETKLPAA